MLSLRGGCSLRQKSGEIPEDGTWSIGMGALKQSELVVLKAQFVVEGCFVVLKIRVCSL